MAKGLNKKERRNKNRDIVPKISKVSTINKIYWEASTGIKRIISTYQRLFRLKRHY